MNPTNTVANEVPTAVPPVPVVAPVAPITPGPTTVAAVTTVPPVVTPPPVESPKKLNLPKIDPKEILPKLKALPLKYKIMAGFVMLLIVLLLLASLTKTGRKVVGIITPTGTPIPTVTPIGDVFVPSPYATDPDVLDIEKKLVDLDTKLKGTNLNEDTLRIPSLDWDVTFKAQ